MIVSAFLITGCAAEVGGKSMPTPLRSAGSGIENTAEPMVTGTIPEAAPIATRTPAPASTQELGDAGLVLVTYGAEEGNVFASGIVPDLVEASAKCTLTAKSGDDVRQASIDAAPATSSMNCGMIRISVPSGEWTLELAYTSEGYSGKSGPVRVVAP